MVDIVTDNRSVGGGGLTFARGRNDLLTAPPDRLVSRASDRASTRPSTMSIEQSALSQPLSLQWYQHEKVFEALRIWQELEVRLANQRIMCSWDWTSTWLHRYGDQVPHAVVVGWSGERAVAITLVCRGVEQWNGPFKNRTIHLGTAGEPDRDSVVVEYNHILSEDVWRDAFLTSIWHELQADSTWDEFRLDGFEADEIACLTSLPGFECRIVPCFHTDFTRLRTDEEILPKLSSQARRIIRRNDRLYPDATVVWSQTTAEALEMFDEMVVLHQRRWNRAGKPGVYSSARFTAFHRELIERLAPRGLIRMIRVVQQHEVIGCNQILVDQGRGLVYQSGHSEHLGVASPGLVVDWYTQLACREVGLKTFDFMGGDTYHKRRLSLHESSLVWAQYRRPRWKFAIAEQLRKGKLWLANATASARNSFKKPVNPVPDSTTPSEGGN